ncbi:uncharacterized protein LOC132264933 isoform X2 [Phlebotomus argentipes]|uniref:uncharacterized protein LOC132264933 isoform X2 n=1 Tax=Phlebotomus argentipes TaxID=94469 RepID=UPI0028930CD0|nr:uncharacterized protein LOC132264933 isoform X2 [Phlebotomus argentipes]XP_059621262.1 uncharacterized protein LOC132264933 isoform X2 [Phlebotomus argentipes]
MNIEISHLKMANSGETGTGVDSAYKNNYVSGANKYWPTLFKLVELALAIVCIGLLDDPANNTHYRTFVTQRTIALCYATFGAYIIISGAYLLGKVFQDTMTWKTAALLNFIGAILFVACGAALLRDWSETKNRNYWHPNTQRMDLLCAAGSVAVVAAVVFLVDLLATMRQGVRGYLE